MGALSATAMAATTMTTKCLASSIAFPPEGIAPARMYSTRMDFIGVCGGMLIIVISLH